MLYDITHILSFALFSLGTLYKLIITIYRSPISDYYKIGKFLYIVANANSYPNY